MSRCTIRLLPCRLTAFVFSHSRLQARWVVELVKGNTRGAFAIVDLVARLNVVGKDVLESIVKVAFGFVDLCLDELLRISLFLGADVLLQCLLAVLRLIAISVWTRGCYRSESYHDVPTREDGDVRFEKRCSQLRMLMSCCQGTSSVLSVGALRSEKREAEQFIEGRSMCCRVRARVLRSRSIHLTVPTHANPVPSPASTCVHF